MSKIFLARAPLAAVAVRSGPRGRFNWKRLGLKLGGTALLLFFVWRLNLDLADLVHHLLRANPTPVAVAVLLIFPIVALKALRWQLLLSTLDISISFREALRLYALGLYAGTLTPGQAGDALKAWQLRQAGHDLSKSFISVVLDRLFDLVVVLMLALLSLLWLGASLGSGLGLILGLVAGLSLAIAGLGVPSLRRAGLNFIVKRIKKKIEPSGQEVELARPTRKQPFHLLAAVGLTGATAALVLARTALTALATGLNLQALETVAASSLATVAGLVPVSVSGVGTRDLTLVGVLGQLGYGASSAVSLSTLLLLLSLANVPVGYGIWASIGGRTQNPAGPEEAPEQPQ